MPFSIERNDLANMQVDAVVVAANEQLQITGGVGATVARAAGFEQVQSACDALGACPTGSAVVTDGFGLPARFIVHAVGPVWQGGAQGERELLRQTYDAALTCAYSVGARSVALSLISAGTYRFPPEVSCAIALKSMREFLDEHEADIRLVLYGREAVSAGMALYGEIAEYIDDHYVEERPSYNAPMREREPWREQERQRRQTERRSSYPSAERMAAAPPPPQASMPPQAKKRRPGLFGRIGEALRKPDETEFMDVVDEAAAEEEEAFFTQACMPGDSAPVLEEPAFGQAEASYPAPSVTGAMPAVGLSKLLDRLDAPFSPTLLALIDARGMDDVQVYKRANMSRQLFSKIRSDAFYQPTKKTVLALCVALELSLGETRDLLARAGFALSHSNKADVIVEYFIAHGNYDIFKINEALYAFDQPLL